MSTIRARFVAADDPGGSLGGASAWGAICASWAAGAVFGVTCGLTVLIPGVRAVRRTPEGTTVVPAPTPATKIATGHDEGG